MCVLDFSLAGLVKFYLLPFKHWEVLRSFYGLFKKKRTGIFLLVKLEDKVYWEKNKRNSIEMCYKLWKKRLLQENIHDYRQFSSLVHSSPTLCNPMDCSMPGLPVHHQLPAFTQTRVHWVGNATQPSHPLSSPFPPAFNLSQHQGLFQGVSSLHQVAEGLKFQLQHQSFQRTPRADLL